MTAADSSTAAPTAAPPQGAATKESAPPQGAANEESAPPLGAAARAGARLAVDLGALRRNWRTLAARLAEGARLAAAVKADAYGLGAGPVVRALAAEGCRDFFVATLDEGRAVRRIAPRAAVYALNGALGGSEAEFARHGLVPVLNDIDAAARWAALARADGVTRTAALHVDTGMARLGMAPEEARRLAADPRPIRGLAPRLLMSHLACADDPDRPMNRAQLAQMRDLRRLWPRAAVSLANSSGIFLGPEYHFDLARAGAALYGINPAPGRPNPMAPVVTLEAEIVALRELDPPASVGYGAAHRVSGRTRVATVPVGYADGYPRRLGGRASALLAGALSRAVEGGPVNTPLPVIGRVSMDLLALDVSALPADAARVGAKVELIGPRRSVDDLAARAGTIGYELLVRLGRRVPRHYVGEAPA